MNNMHCKLQGATKKFQKKIVVAMLREESQKTLKTSEGRIKERRPKIQQIERLQTWWMAIHYMNNHYKCESFKD